MAEHKTQEILRTVIFFAFSAGLLTLIQAPFDAAFLAWFALVPLAMISRPEAKAWRLAWISYLVSMVYWVGNLYWIGYVTVPGYLLLGIFMGMYWPVLALCVRFVRRKGWPLFIFLPILFTGAEAWQGILFTGFSWRLLGHSQYQNLELIQIADIFGALGVTFIVAMVNGLIADIGIAITQNSLLKFSHIVKVAIVGLALFLAMDYGQKRLAETPEYVTAGPKIGSVQPNIPSHIKEEAEAGDEILDELLISTRKCYEAGADLVAWPETIVLATLNDEFLKYCKPDSRPVEYHKKISDFVTGKGYLLLGAHSSRVGIVGEEYQITNRWNSALLYEPSGEQAPERFDKIHLVPFGEYIPFHDSFPFVITIMGWLSPYDYDYSLDHGDQYTLFNMQTKEQTYKFGSIICYEDTDPRIVRRLVWQDNQKKADWLVNLSNDGWYVRYKDGKFYPSTELPQRVAITVFRCIENRIAVARSVNTGISCLIDTKGEIKDGYIEGNLPINAMERQGVGGYFIDTVPIDSRTTIFSRHGQLIDIFCGAAFALTSFIVIICDFKRARREKMTG